MIITIPRIWRDRAVDLSLRHSRKVSKRHHKDTEEPKIRKLTKSLFIMSAVAAASCTVADNEVRDHTRPKLVLQITVDQLRGDLPDRYYDRLGEGGFRYLWENGVVYRNAHHAHANTETIVGHTTLATGAHPSGRISLTVVHAVDICR